MALKLTPHFLYGTAWKEAATADCVVRAVKAGFRAIDTANQRKHYHEVGVGEALASLYEQGLVSREELFLQTKFTYLRGQDHRLPYDPDASYTTQVQQSFQSSLEHLHTSWLDSYVLHGPASAKDFIDTDREVWCAMEKLHQSGQTKHLGVSNINANQLTQLLEFAEIKPTFVQNRCYAQRLWDADIRKICDTHDVIYQGFSLLTANRFVNQTPLMTELTQKYNKTTAQVIFRFARQVKMLPLTGTTSDLHMKQDLDIEDFELSQSEVDKIEQIAAD